MCTDWCNSHPLSKNLILQRTETKIYNWVKIQTADHREAITSCYIYNTTPIPRLKEHHERVMG